MHLSQSYFEEFIDIQKEIRILTNSQTRIKILNFLMKNSASIKEIKKNTGLSHSSISNNLSKLIESGHVLEKEDKYYIKNSTKFKLINYNSLNNSLNAITKNTELLNDHIVDKINFEGLKDLSNLKELSIIESTSDDVYKAIRLFKDYFVGSSSLKAIFPFIHPQKSVIGEDWFNRDVDIKLILPPAIFKALINIVKNNELDYVKNKHLQLKSVNENILFALIVADKGIALGLCKKDGSFNQNLIMVSDSDEAIEWGLEVFNEFESKEGEYVYIKDYLNKEDK